MKSFFSILIVLSFSLNCNAKENTIIFLNPVIKYISTNAKNASGYLTIKNNTDKDIILLSVSSEISKSTEIHDMKIQNDIMTMQKIEMPIIIPSNTKFMLKPKGLHIMFMKIKKQLIENRKEEILFNFKNHGEFKVLMKIKKNVRYHNNDDVKHSHEHKKTIKVIK